MVTNTNDIAIGDWVRITSRTSDWRDKIGVIRQLYDSGNYGISLHDTETSVIRKFSRGGFTKRSEPTSHNDQTDRIGELERRIEDLQLRVPADTRSGPRNSNQSRGQSRPGGHVVPNTSRQPPQIQAPTVAPLYFHENTSKQSRTLLASLTNVQLHENISSQSRSGGRQVYEDTSQQSRKLQVSVTNVLYHENSSRQSQTRANRW